MRKYQKNELLELMKTFRSAHESLKKPLRDNDAASVLTVLTGLQEGAITAGNVIEASEGEGTVAVKKLEDYCEAIFTLHSAISSGTRPNPKEAVRMLNAPLNEAREHIENDFTARSEVVFLPYKASMWDSLESVWREADADENCDAYVIPIPYITRNDKGEGEVTHYEGNLFPDDVPVFPFDKYDFEARHPDTIFIHNPYDDYNYITSVHPFFYSTNLKKYTEELVYIPYFILAEIDPDNDEAVEANAHFFVTPGVMNADKVIVQSENMARCYIKALTKYVEGTDKAYWEKRILGLGSPKIDKVLSTKREDVTIPEEWLPVLDRQDGTRRKVILYNTSVSSLLEHENDMLEKMKDVFRIFKENREDVALLWRPHPLIRDTIISMRPQLLEAYDRIVKDYRADGFGIYDDTPDMDRAIALSDAYYGDPSSLVELCRAVGMPVMIQNVDIR